MATVFLRQLGRAVCGVALYGALSASVAWAEELPEVVMYKDPNCGCCGKWVEHMQENGFTVKEIVSSDMGRVKQEAGVPQALGSCHTAKVDGYVVEGHVPAEDVKRLLTERPKLSGIATPGMPAGSPGMEVPGYEQPYEVIGFSEDGQTSTFASH